MPAGRPNVYPEGQACALDVPPGHGPVPRELRHLIDGLPPAEARRILHVVLG